jgi:hypothetical protein
VAGRHAPGGALLRRHGARGRRLEVAARPRSGRRAGADGRCTGGAGSGHGADGLRGGHALAEKKSGGEDVVWGCCLGMLFGDGTLGYDILDILGCGSAECVAMKSGGVPGAVGRVLGGVAGVQT